MKTPYQIAQETDHLNGRANTTRINAIFREGDESHKWPVNGRFNATERAIRRVRKLCQETGGTCEGLEYCLNLDLAISDIVNGSV